MQRGAVAFALAFGLSIGTPAWADYKPYPGATKLDQAATEKSRQMGSGTRTTTIFTTPDSWDKVFAFYQSLGKEYKMPGRSSYERQLPSGGPKVKQAFFIFDGAPDLATSQHWLTIATPFIGDVRVEGGEIRYGDIRNGLTGISHVEPNK